MSVVGTEIDKLARLYAKRKKAAAAFAKAKAEEDAQTEKLTAIFTKAKVKKQQSAKGHTFSLNPTLVATVDDWNRLGKWIVKHDCPEMLQRRVKLETYREYLEEGTVPDGTSPETILKPKFTAAR